ncbi:MAG: low specificity L-threonine aldolase, partial [Anaerolineae bacterium]|nr:low specificity L-threonine aldolase [Anaerolineae bacterium]
SNIVIFEVDHPTVSPEQLVDELWEQGVWTFAIGGKRVRAVTNYHVSVDDIDNAAQAVAAALDG